MSTTAERLAAIEATLTRIERAIQTHVPAADERAHIAEAETTAGQVSTLAGASPIQGQQLDAIVTTLDAQLPAVELRDKLQNELFFVRQLISVMQGTRDDVVAMRVTLRGLSALLEQVLQARVADEEWEQRGIDRRAGERRRAG